MKVNLNLKMPVFEWIRQRRRVRITFPDVGVIRFTDPHHQDHCEVTTKQVAAAMLREARKSRCQVTFGNDPIYAYSVVRIDPKTFIQDDIAHCTTLQAAREVIRDQIVQSRTIFHIEPV